MIVSIIIWIYQCPANNLIGMHGLYMYNFTLYTTLLFQPSGDGKPQAHHCRDVNLEIQFFTKLFRKKYDKIRKSSIYKNEEKKIRAWVRNIIVRILYFESQKFDD